MESINNIPIKKPRIVAIVQGRMSSSRLPGKVLKDIHGLPMLAWVIQRSCLTQSLDEVVVATTVEPSDDPIQTFCESQGFSVFRGDAFDVLDRYYQAAKQFEADVVVRLTADCPLIDPGIIDETVAAFFETKADFAANRLPPPWKRTFPIGLDTEVCSFAALQQAWKEADQPYQREHVMPYLYDEEGRFRIHVVNHDPDYGHYRWTVDTPEDLVLIRQIIDQLGGRMDFSWKDVLVLQEKAPELFMVNASVKHKTMRDVDERLNQK